MSRAERLTATGALVALALVLACGPQVAGPSVPQAPPPAPLLARAAPEAPRLSAAAPTPAMTAAPAAHEATAPPSPPPAAPAPRDPLAVDPLMTQLLGGGGAALKAIVATPARYRFQVLYGVIRPGVASLVRHAYRADAEYFFPASSMKVPIALATYDHLAVLRRAGKSGLTRDATIRIAPLSGAAEPYVTTLARETWRALIVSDNFSANRLLGFVGHREVHETLWARGLASARIHAGFATGAEIDPAELSPRIEVEVEGGAAQEIAARRSDLVLPPTDARSLAVGEAAIINGRRVPGPLSFADKNAMGLRDLQDTLVRIMRPELLPPPPRVEPASADDLAHVRHALGTLPSESGLAGFERNVIADYQLSPFLRGIERVRARGRFEIYSKVGQAFGFLIANAYVVDKATGRAFFLTAAVYANPDETMNDDTYAYDSISYPALADVAEAFCRHAFAP